MSSFGGFNALHSLCNKEMVLPNNVQCQLDHHAPSEVQDFCETQFFSCSNNNRVIHNTSGNSQALHVTCYISVITSQHQWPPSSCMRKTCDVIWITFFTQLGQVSFLHISHCALRHMMSKFRRKLCRSSLVAILTRVLGNFSSNSISMPNKNTVKSKTGQWEWPKNEAILVYSI